MAYDWGRRGDGAVIHRLRRSLGAAIEASEPAAELWMGDHPRAPSRLGNPNGAPLDRAIAEHSEHFLGPTLAARGFRSLPFLFKVLDAARPLSIQAHPDRERARELHARDPHNYPDTNHKPELAVCIEGMRALVGFRTPQEIATFCNHAPEFAALCSSEGQLFSEAPPAPPPGDEAGARQWIRNCYSHLMRSSKHEISEAVRSLRLRLDALSDSGGLLDVDGLFLQLTTQFGDEDAGVFSVYFLNLVQLEPGEALYLGPDEPHTYLGGAMLEIMAASDNVVRAGLTSKFCDIETLLEMLHFRGGPPQVLRPTASGERRSSFAAPASDFQLEILELERAPLSHSAADRPAILLSLASPFRVEVFRQQSLELVDATEVAAGAALFLPGDLATRGLEARLSAPAATQVHMATVGPDF